MKSIIYGAFIAIAVTACLSLNVQAKPINPSHAISVTDTGKMDKMKMDKMKMDKKMDKMKKDSMKMSKKMSKKKMAKDTASKM